MITEYILVRGTKEVIRRLRDDKGFRAEFDLDAELADFGEEAVAVAALAVGKKLIYWVRDNEEVQEKIAGVLLGSGAVMLFATLSPVLALSAALEAMGFKVIKEVDDTDDGWTPLDEAVRFPHG